MAVVICTDEHAGFDCLVVGQRLEIEWDLCDDSKMLQLSGVVDPLCRN